MSFYGIVTLSYNLPMAATNSSLSNCYPISSSSINKGLNTSRRFVSSIDMSIFIDEIYPSTSESNHSKI